MILYQDIYLWNDTPVVEEGRWRLLVPNNYAKKYKDLFIPLVVHRCPTDELQRDWVMTKSEMKEAPVCDKCGEWCPDNIQGVYVLHQFEEMTE